MKNYNSWMNYYYKVAVHENGLIAAVELRTATATEKFTELCETTRQTPSAELLLVSALRVNLIVTVTVCFHSPNIPMCLFRSETEIGLQR